MIDLAARYDGWHAAQTLLPLVAGGFGALVLWKGPTHLGKVVIAYATICILLVLSPMWLGDYGETGLAALRPVLVESKLAFVVGLAIVLAAGGRTPQPRPD
jgi:hypothetical protein